MGNKSAFEEIESSVINSLQGYREYERRRYVAGNFLRFGDTVDVDELMELRKEEAARAAEEKPEDETCNEGRLRESEGTVKGGQGEGSSDGSNGQCGVEDSFPIPRSQYDDCFDLAGTLELLGIFDTPAFSLGLLDTNLEEIVEEPPLAPGTHQCDFCARPLAGGFDRLRDGRERCTACTRTVVKSARDAKDLFSVVKRKMVTAFDIEFKNPIDAKIVDARKLHKRMGEAFVPTAGFDPRTLGFVVNKPGRQEMWIENGAPRNALMSTIAHELTHVWQHQQLYFLNLPTSVKREIYLLISEGMATWTEVQFLKLVDEYDDAEAKIEEYHRRKDEYGLGFRLYEARYGFSEGGYISKDTPFMHPNGPLS